MATATSLALLLAQGAGDGDATAGQTTLTVFLVVVLVVIWVALGIVCWIFWRAKRREDKAKAEQANSEAPWQNAHSS